jgi:hypothetical protein
VTLYREVLVPFHQDQDVSFESPPEWANRTIVGHAAPALENDARAIVPNFVMTRQAMREGESLRTHADREIFQLGRRLEGFELLESSDTILAGSTAVHFRYRWVSHVGPLEQSLTVVERAANGERFTMLFTTTTTVADAPVARPVLSRIFQTIRFGEDVGRTSPPPPLELTRPSALDAPPKSVPMPGVRRGYR